MRILWLTWKDKKNPCAGGAELVSSELCKRLSKQGHEVIVLSSDYNMPLKEENISGYKVIRTGSRFTVYWKAYRYYKKNLKDWADIIIEEINVVPFFSKFYAREKKFLFVHQLCRAVWFYQMFFPFNLVGYLAEPFYLRLLSDLNTITVSKSTKKDLIKYGFKKEKIKIISEGIAIKPAVSIENIEKFTNPTILCFGNIRSMKRSAHVLKAFEKAKDSIKDLQLIIAGGPTGRYGKNFIKRYQNSKFIDSIKYFGCVSNEQKIELMRKCHLICVTSVKEGWGLVVTEANSQGTPAIVYNVDGLRDSVNNNETGIVCGKNHPKVLADNIIKILKDKELYNRLRFNAWEWSKHINFEKSFRDFIKNIKK